MKRSSIYVYHQGRDRKISLNQNIGKKKHRKPKAEVFNVWEIALIFYIVPEGISALQWY